MFGVWSWCCFKGQFSGWIICGKRECQSIISFQYGTLTKKQTLWKGVPETSHHFGRWKFWNGISGLKMERKVFKGKTMVLWCWRKWAGRQPSQVLTSGILHCAVLSFPYFICILFPLHSGMLIYPNRSFPWLYFLCACETLKRVRKMAIYVKNHFLPD